MYQIVGKKIRKLREEMRLTQNELAKSVGLSSEFISLLELGRRTPSLESLSRIAGYLKKDIAYFMMEKEEPFNFLLRGEGLNEGARRVLKKFKRYCHDYLDLEEKTGRYPNLAPLYKNVTAERMAEQERRRLGLGNEPVRNIFFLLEINGLHLLRCPIAEDSKISGVYIFIDLKQAAFALVNSSQSLGRQTLTAAHQYGHYLKDRYDDPVIDNPDIFIDEYLSLYHPRERFAQRFASCFLMPQEKVEDIVAKDISKTRLSLEDIIYLKRYFGVSTFDMLRTLQEMEFISPTRRKEYLKIDTDGREKVLFGNIAEHEVEKTRRGGTLVSDRFVSLALEAYKKKKISREKLARIIHKNKATVESIIKK